MHCGKIVQDIGYRVSLLTSALTFGVEKFNAQNTFIKDKQAVVVHIGAEEEIIEEFYNYITENIPPDAVVSNFIREEFKGKIMDIDKYLHLVQIEQLNKGIPAILDIRENTRLMLELQVKTLGKQDKTLEKQETMIHILGSINADTTEMRYSIKRVESDVKDTKLSLSELIETKLREHEIELKEIKYTLAKVQEAISAT